MKEVKKIINFFSKNAVEDSGNNEELNKENNKELEDDKVITNEIENENANDEQSINQALENENEGMSLRRGRRVDCISLHRTGISHMQVKGSKQFMEKVKRIDRELRKKKIIIKDIFKKVASVTMAHIKSVAKHKQVSIKEGIQRHRELAIRAVLKEYI